MAVGEWVTISGTRINFVDMPDSHLTNTIAFIKKKLAGKDLKHTSRLYLTNKLFEAEVEFKIRERRAGLIKALEIAQRIRKENFCPPIDRMLEDRNWM